MSYEKLLEGINLNIKDRFINDTRSSDEILKLSPEVLALKYVYRLERIAKPEVQTKKTILVVSVEDIEKLTEVLRWAAVCKEVLLDPESSDLYLFLCFNQKVSLDTCLRIESTEQFCRKYVLHPKEKIDSFLERTFLAKPNLASQDLISTDPVIKTFRSLQDEYEWFGLEEQEKWKKILLSGLSGPELIDELFNLNL